MRTQWFWPGTVLASGAVLGTLIAAGVGSPWRAILAVWFLLICPGASVVEVLGLPDRLVELVVVAPLSLALVTLTSLTLFYARLWSLHTELWLVGGLCLAGLISSYFCSRRQPKGI